MRKNDAFDAKIVNTRLTKIFIAIFAPDEREAGEDTGTYFREITDLEFQNHKNVKKMYFLINLLLLNCSIIIIVKIH